MFEIFRDDGGRWCARRSDGLVGGVFRDRAEAERFARMEAESAPPMAPPLHELPKSALVDPGLELIPRPH